MESTQIIIIFIMGCTQIFIIPVIIFILENIQIVIVTNHHNVDVDANQLGHIAEKRRQEASLSSKARQGRPGSQARQGRPGQKKLRKKRGGRQAGWTWSLATQVTWTLTSDFHPFVHLNHLDFPDTEHDRKTDCMSLGVNQHKDILKQLH